MLERFSDQAARAVDLARTEARSLGHGHVGTEHLLLGILAEGDNPAASALLACGATLYGCREMAAEAVGAGGVEGDGRAARDPEYTERASRALERASRLALRRRHPMVDTTHVLASVLDVEGRAGQVLRGLGVDPARVHAALDSPIAPAVASQSDPVEAPPASDPRPLCANCGAPLERSLAERAIKVAGAGAWLVAYCASCGSAIGAARADGA